MKVLFAVNNENISESILKKYQKDNTGINKLNIHKRLEIKIN